ncbi:MAG: hypothetical protein KF749_15820 [Bacteroidetes bacterium]|nr:hypothetical protein [Bacteroidota bacterium]MCW5897344.1 hypothetical protein [Bacteroidota bacterium]
MTHKHENHGNDSVARGHETSDVDVKSVAISGILLSAGLVIAGILFSWWMYTVFQSHTAVPDAPATTFAVPDPAKLPSEPRLQADPKEMLAPFILSQDSILASYGWVNKDSGIARIPIERAMALAVERGFPVEGKK